MKKKFFLYLILAFTSSLGLFFFGQKISHIKVANNIIFASNPAIASLIKAVTGDEFEIKILGYYNENFHQHSVSPETLLHLQNAKMLFFTSIYEEPSIYLITQNLPNLNSIEIFANDSLLKKIHQNYYYSQKYAKFESNRQKIDPHFWLSAQASSYVLQTIFEIMSDSFPDKIDIFKKNYDFAQTEMQLLIKQGRSYIIKCDYLNVFAVHDAFFYLHKDYNFKYNGGISDNLEYGLLPNSISQLIKLDKQNKVCIILKNNTSEPLIQKIKSIAPNARYTTIDFDGVSIDYVKSIAGYKEFFIANIKNLTDCACK